MPPDKFGVTFGLSVGYETGRNFEGGDLFMDVDRVSRKMDSRICDLLGSNTYGEEAGANAPFFKNDYASLLYE
jgi:hypothetical protein